MSQRRRKESTRCSSGRASERASVRAAGHIRAQGRSGLTVAAYCAAHGVSASTFYRWKRVFQGDARGGRDEGAAEARRTAVKDDAGPKALFAEVAAPTVCAQERCSGVEVELASGLRIRVAPGFDAETLRRVITTLEDERC